MAGWQPQQAGLIQLCNLFAVSQKGENQTQILQQLEQYKAYPDFNNYLAYIFATAEQVPLEVRQSAGLYLKNSLRQHYATTDGALQAYIKAALGPMLAHGERALRHTAGSCIATVVVAGGIAAWPQLVPLLHQCFTAGSASARDGGLDTLYKIVEESPVQMEVTVPGGPGQAAAPASSHLVPALLQLLQSAPPEPRRNALSILNLMARDMPAGISQNLDEYLHALFALAHDTAPGVRQEVVRGMVQLLAIRPDKLQPFLFQVIEYMLQSNEVADEAIRLESAEFWTAFCEARLDPELLWPFMPRLIPMLMNNMVFDEHDEEVQDAEAAEAAVATPERSSELRPLHHRAGARHAGPPDQDDDDDDDDEAYSRWNLRKCSAAGLDRLAVLYGDKLLPVVMPIVQQRLQVADWRPRESAILALGAISEGCHLGLLPHLGPMVGLLLPKLTETAPMVRIITCWTLGRYSYWLLAGAQEAAAAAAAAAGASATPPDPGAPPGLHIQLGAVVAGLLRAALDHNKFVQDAACSAVAELCQTAGREDAGAQLHPYLPDLVTVLSRAVTQYGRRNLHLACDALCMLGEAVGSALGDSQLSGQFMPALCNRVATLGPHDRELIPLLECAIMAGTCLGQGISPWAPALFQTAMSVIAAQATLRANGNGGARSSRRAANANAAAPKHDYDVDLHALALDVISGLAEVLGASIEPLVAGTPLPQYVLAACQDAVADVRQSGFALVGDLSRGAVSLLLPVAPQIVEAGVACLSPQAIKEETMRSCNNACWSLGELAIKMQPGDVAAWAGTVAERAAALLVAGPSHLPHSLLQNAGITLGRIAVQAPDLLAPHLAHFCTPWCQALRNVRDDVEKEQAFHGLLALLARNPEPVSAPGPAFAALAGALVSWRTMRDPTLQAGIQQMLQALMAHMRTAGAWDPAIAGLEPAVAQKLAALSA